MSGIGAESRGPGAFGDNALALRWAFGFNKDVVGGVHSLSESSLFYVAAHTGIIYDFRERRQKLLQGHSNTITCARAPPRRAPRRCVHRLLCTATPRRRRRCVHRLLCTATPRRRRRCVCSGV